MLLTLALLALAALAAPPRDALERRRDELAAQLPPPRLLR